MFEQIGQVLRRRNPPDFGDVRARAREVIARRLRSQEAYYLAWAGAIGTILSDLPLFDPEMNPEVLAAFREQYPQAYGALTDDQIVERIQQLDPNQVNGIENAVKGKLLEMKVVDRLNEGESLGEFRLFPGQHAELADAANQPGFDILIRNADGSVTDALSAKCSNDLDAIREALDRYPDFKIVANTELAEMSPDILDSGFTEEELVETVKDSLEAAESIGGALDTVGNFLPGLPLVLVAAKRGIPVLMGRSTFESALKKACPELAEAFVFAGIGVVLAFMDAGLISIPVMLGGRWLWHRFKERSAVEQMLQDARRRLAQQMDGSLRFAWAHMPVGFIQSPAIYHSQKFQPQRRFGEGTLLDHN